MTDINIPMRSLDTNLFPGVSSNVLVHSGFADQHAMTARTILAEVKTQLSQTGSTNVFVVRILPHPSS